MNRPIVCWHKSPFTNCTVLSISTVHVYLCAADKDDPCEADDGDLSETDDGKLATARSRTLKLPPRFSEASHAAKTFFLALSQLKVKELPPSPVKLVVHAEGDGSDLCEADRG